MRNRLAFLNRKNKSEFYTKKFKELKNNSVGQWILVNHILGKEGKIKNIVLPSDENRKKLADRRKIFFIFFGRFEFDSDDLKFRNETRGVKNLK